VFNIEKNGNDENKNEYLLLNSFKVKIKYNYNHILVICIEYHALIMKQLAIYACIVSVLLLASCHKKHDEPYYYTHPYPAVLPDTGHFVVPYANQNVNGYTTYYYPNTNIISSQGNYQNGSPSGYWKQYYPNGNMMKEGNYSNGQLSGNWIFYYSTGVKEEEGNYQNNTKNGNWTTYYPNGIMSSQGNYVNDVKQGQWNYYNTDGTPNPTH